MHTVEFTRCQYIPKSTAYAKLHMQLQRPAIRRCTLQLLPTNKHVLFQILVYHPDTCPKQFRQCLHMQTADCNSYQQRVTCSFRSLFGIGDTSSAMNMLKATQNVCAELQLLPANRNLLFQMLVQEGPLEWHHTHAQGNANV